MFLLEGEREVKHDVADRNAERKFAGIRVAFEPHDASGFLAGGEFGVLEGEGAKFGAGRNDCRVIPVGGLHDMFAEVIRGCEMIRGGAGRRCAVFVIRHGARGRLRICLGEEHLMVRELGGILREQGFQVGL